MKRLTTANQTKLLNLISHKLHEVGVAKVAEELGISHTSLYRMFKPGAMPTLSMVLRLTQYLGIRIEASF